MTDRELMQMALDALEVVTARMLDCRDELAERGGRPQTNVKHRDLWDLAFLAYTKTAIPTAGHLRAALAQPEPEPVAWMYQDKSTNEVRFQKHMRAFVDHGATDEVPLYIAPPQREWHGLTDEEVGILTVFDGLHHVEVPLLADFARAIEAKLKEKNNG